MADNVQDLEKVKVSELPDVVSYVGLYTLGTDGYFRSVRVPLDILGRIGDIDDLITTDKSTLVAAINEAARTGGGGGTNITGYVKVPTIGDLPVPGAATLGYLVDDNLYLYVGTGGDTKGGAYENCGPFRGPQGPQGRQGNPGPQGNTGPQGLPGQDGRDGRDGQDGRDGRDGQDGAPGPTGPAAGFGNPIATVDGNTGEPEVTVNASGPDTAKVFTFTFKNLKGADGLPGDDGMPGPPGPAGVTSVVIVVGSNTGTPTGQVSLVDGVLTIALDGIKGLQGNSGYSGAAGELQVVNNLEQGGATDALSAEQGKILKQMIQGKFVFLTESEYEALTTKDPSKIYCTYEDEEETV